QTKNRPQVFHLWNPVSLTIQKSVDTGQDNQKARPAQNRNLSRQAVIIAESQFINGDRIIFVDDRYDVPESKKPLQCIPRILVACAAIEVVVGKQELSDVQTMPGKERRVKLHQPRLADRGARLYRGEILWALRKLQ